MPDLESNKLRIKCLHRSYSFNHMNRTKTFKILILFMLTTALPINAVLAEEASPIPVVTDEFRYSLTPYLWFSSVNGVLDYKNTPVADTSLNANKILSNLAVGGMFEGEIHYNNWGVMGNAIYAKLSNGGSKSYLRDNAVTVDSKSDAWLGIYTAAGTYTAYASKSIYLDVLAGARFFNMNTKVQLDSSVNRLAYNHDTTLYSSTSATDAIAGVKGRVRLGESKFYVPYYVDAGGGSAIAKFTTQELLGIGYAFNYADVSLVYNNLYYSMSNNNKSSYVNMSGPMIAATFRF